MNASVDTADSRPDAAPRALPPLSRNAALRAASVTETRIAEALARARDIVTLVKQLTRRASADAADLAEASDRLDGLCETLRVALTVGEPAAAGDLRTLAVRTLGAFDMAEGPRILIEGPPIALHPEAMRVVSLALFDLASRGVRFGALGVGEGRVALDWAEDGGGLHLTWREFGVRPGSERLRRGPCGALQELLADRLGAPLRQLETPFGLVAELAIPAWAIREGAGPTPRRVLVAVEDAAVAAALSPPLMACGVREVGTVCTVAEA